MTILFTRLLTLFGFVMMAYCYWKCKLGKFRNDYLGWLCIVGVFLGWGILLYGFESLTDFI